MPNDNFNLFEHVILLSDKFTAYKGLLEFVFSHSEVEVLSPSFSVLGDDLDALIAELILLSAQ